MHPFRYSKIWLTVGWLLIALVVFLSLWPKPPEIDIKEGDKLAHILAYTTLMLWFANIYPKYPTRIRISLAFLVMGISLEFLQGISEYRTFSYADVFADGFGILLGLGLAKTDLASFLLHLDRWLLRFS